VRTPRWWATTQRAICNRGRKGGFVGISLIYPAMASVASVKRGERAGVTKEMRKREADWVKEARALVSTRQAHERTHAHTTHK
jgi:hypothetical protein